MNSSDEDQLFFLETVLVARLCDHSPCFQCTVKAQNSGVIHNKREEIGCPNCKRCECKAFILSFLTGNSYPKMTFSFPQDGAFCSQ